jgi:hypothetical protein
VLRGGAYNNNPRDVRCAYRNRNNPDNRNDNIGFRVVASTLSSLPEMRRVGPGDGCAAEAENGGAYSWPRLGMSPGPGE